MALDGDAIVRRGVVDPSISIGRPAIARALVAGGFAASSDDAFDRWLERGALLEAALPAAGSPSATRTWLAVATRATIVALP